MENVQKDLSVQFARIKETIEKIVGEGKCFMEQICAFFHDRVIIITSILIALSITISTTVTAFTGVFGGGRGPASPNILPKNEEVLKNE